MSHYYSRIGNGSLRRDRYKGPSANVSSRILSIVVLAKVVNSSSRENGGKSSSEEGTAVWPRDATGAPPPKKTIVLHPVALTYAATAAATAIVEGDAMV